MLPKVIQEAQVFTFKFWFNETIRQGMYYQDELFCKLATFEIEKRPQVYQVGCKLARQEASVILTLTPSQCSLWGSLRTKVVRSVLLGKTALNLPEQSQSLPSEPPGASIIEQRL